MYKHTYIYIYIYIYTGLRWEFHSELPMWFARRGGGPGAARAAVS